MAVQIQAVYEDGVLRPLAPLELTEHQMVTLTLLESDGDLPRLDGGYLDLIRKDLEGSGPAPDLAEVRRRLSKIPGNLTDGFIAERADPGER